MSRGGNSKDCQQRATTQKQKFVLSQHIFTLNVVAIGLITIQINHL